MAKQRRTSRPKAKQTFRRKSTAPSFAAGKVPVIYIHGIGDHPDGAEALKHEFDLALFGRDMGGQTRMAFWADILHPAKTTAGAKGVRSRSNENDRELDVDALLEDAGVVPTPESEELANGLLRTFGLVPLGVRKKVLPLPAFLRKPIARAFLQALIKDTAAYFFRKGMREMIQERLWAVLPQDGEPAVIVAHSQGTIVALEVLAELKDNPLKIGHFITLGSPLGIREVQDFLTCELVVPSCVEAWSNFSDPLDPVALDKGIGDDFAPASFIADKLVLNSYTRRLEGFNPHSAVGYLANPAVRDVVCRSARIDNHARFVVARDVAAGLAVEARQPVLIEILEPGYPALGETKEQMHLHESKVEQGHTDLVHRVTRAAQRIEAIVPPDEMAAARIDSLRRFVAARLTPSELVQVATLHKDMRIYSVWKSAPKRKLIRRSGSVVQVDAARASYRADGRNIRWAVLDTGVRHDHPHFRTYGTIESVWDCTQVGPPTRIANDRDRDGHGSHVAGIIAGGAADGSVDGSMQGMAPLAKLVVYKVLNDRGEGEDAWIIKALDHIAAQNENNATMLIHGLNLSLGGPYDATVYGCGFTPICVELRRLWRAGVLVCVASGNEGQVQVNTPAGELELNCSMSIGDPANLEDCIAVGSVNADRPHLHGVSSFSSRGPTSDGRIKPDVVAPGERIRSCDSHYSNGTPEHLYKEESGTSMAAPHVSGLLAAFLSVRREFCGRPDEVKALMLRTCIDLHRDRYHQGHGVPNLMRMLLEA